MKIPDWMKLVPMMTVVLFLGIIIGLLFRFYMPEKNAMDYKDFVTILLTVVTVLLAVLGFVVAIVAILGWNGITQHVRNSVEQFLEKNSKEDPEINNFMNKAIKKAFDTYLEREINSEHNSYILLKQIVNEIVYGDKQDGSDEQ